MSSQTRTRNLNHITRSGLIYIKLYCTGNLQIQEVGYIRKYILRNKEVHNNDAEIRNYRIKKKLSRINVEDGSVKKIALWEKIKKP